MGGCGVTSVLSWELVWEASVVFLGSLENLVRNGLASFMFFLWDEHGNRPRSTIR